ncbi:MAG: TIGR00725 family protein [Fidelibacterota bacterium]|nr:MAG: TIGR00725 family protein [Candidatus Neomarinimicrobiota bacterium]
MKRSPIIGVMGGGQVSEEIADLARDLGRALAREGWIVLSGGRNTGVMAAVSEGAANDNGVVVGILPDKNLEQASPHLTIPIRTGLGDSRNIVNILSSDVVVALPGSAGTLSEIALAIKNDKPLLLLGWKQPPIILHDHETATSLHSIVEVVDRIKELLSAHQGA